MIKVMVVDDQEDMRLLIALTLETSDIDARVSCEASNGGEALALLGNCEPHVIVLDQMMPGMRGTDCAVQIRESRPDARMLLFSAHLDRALAEEATALGLHYLTKDRLDELPVAVQQMVA